MYGLMKIKNGGKRNPEKLGKENREFQESCRGKTYDEILKLAMEQWNNGSKRTPWECQKVDKPLFSSQHPTKERYLILCTEKDNEFSSENLDKALLLLRKMEQEK